MNFRPPILFLHGNWGDKRSWNGIAKRLSVEGHEVLCIDMPDRKGAAGVGSRYIDEYTLAAEVAVEFCEMQYGMSPVVFGHSLGGTIALKLAAKRKLSGLFLIAPSAPVNVPKASPVTFGAVRLFLPWLLQGIARRGNFEFAYKPPLWSAGAMFTGWPREAIIQAHYNMHPDSAAITSEFFFRKPSTKVDQDRIRCPVICIAGSRDSLSTPSAVKALADWCKGEFQELPGSHFLHWEAENVAPLLAHARRFLDQLEKKQTLIDVA